jgi:chemotaxis response regulator CheB
MPKEAIQTGCVHDVLTLEVIIERVLAFSTDARF